MITALDHIADRGAGPSRRPSSASWRISACPSKVPKTCRRRKTSTAFFPLPPTSIELVHPLNGEGAIAKYLEKKPGGLHHICFRSDNIEEDVERLKEKGYQFLADEPTPGAHGSQVIFIHPKSCDGVLIEINQPAEEH